MRAPKPWHFFFLILPYGASFGYVSVTLPYIAGQRGISVEAIAAVIAAAFAPHAPKFLWAPVVDVTASRKRWYLAALVLVALGTAASMAMPIDPSSLGALTAVIVASQLGLTFLGMSCEGLIGRGIAPSQRGAASGWFQAGTFLGAGLGGGAAIELVSRFGGAAGGCLIGAAMAACAWPLAFFDEPEAERRKLADALRSLRGDLVDLVRTRGGVATLLVCLSPIGAGAASNLFGAIAGEWHASREIVALTTGALSGVVSAAGAGAGGWLATRVQSRRAYAIAGACTAAAGAAMALAPHAAWSYAGMTLLYQAFNGAGFAAFSTMAFEAAGKGAVATKYNVMASLFNTSIAYMTRVDGAAHARWGANGLLFADAATSAAALAVFVIVLAVTRKRTNARAPR